jgi:hypothetical protein
VPSTKQAQNKHRLAKNKHRGGTTHFVPFLCLAQNWRKTGTTFMSQKSEHKRGTNIAQKRTESVV